MRLSLSSIALATALAVCSPAFAEEAPAPAPAEAPAAEPASPPKLIVAISVDQFSADLFAQYREHFSKGFARLLTGAVFPSGYQSHAATETCPGHSTLLTGVHPARTGIVANNWYVPGIGRKDKKVYCVEDETNPESTSKNPVVSPDHLKAPTLGDLMKKANPATINAAVSAKDRAAVMMSGHDTDAVYWFQGKGFTTFADRKISRAVVAGNTALQKIVDAGDGALPVPGWCGAVDRAVKVGDFTIGTYRFPLKAGDYAAYGYGPRLDAATGDMAIRMVDELGMGKDAVPDVLSVSFSQTDRVGHAFGTEGVEMCIQLAQLDATLGQLFDALDARGLDYAVVLTADHGGFDAPERLDQEGYPDAKRMSEDLEIGALADAVSQDTGITAPQGKLLYGGGGSGDIYLASGLTDEQRKTVIDALVARLRDNPEVASIYTAEQLEQLPVPHGNPQDWTMIERVRASFDPERSGQVLMMTRRGVVPIVHPGPGYVATHGSPWDYDRRVPIVFWRKGMTGEEQPAPVETVDIAPTLAALVGLKEPEGTWDGRCLDIDGSEADTCAR
ncbi:alkaline phosphatase family protein [Novosphingobium mangrovi (ex Huang et al. 2023)]|uniref:Alkaline phosphatase n=1 Tax=Novosphingobium mangrovi (ex Huang et al. 2023) TaxID=2976432 RepID=A0ABT2I006_9SPHN|nr:alkaline phosphatase family protein [Novosphingobium mangrovi (ex Huang et al. 2023)]MCT2398138.1 alkaline phosphatase family protein [Novosphingobium mangrovi (ex Huang et al. 2023)]